MSFSCVILAAGEGRRAGGYKPLMEIGGRAVIDRVIEAAAAVADEIRVVGGAEFERLERHLESLPWSVELVRNEAWELGMFSSVQRGLAGLSTAVFVHPADIPGPGAGVYRALAEAYERDPRAVLRPAFEKRRGHPILLSPASARAVREAPASSNLKEVLSRLSPFDVDILDDLVLFDFDTLAELAALRERLE